MAPTEDQQEAKIAKYIDDSLKQVFSDLQRDEMPDKISDLLMVLRAQDKDHKAQK